MGRAGQLCPGGAAVALCSCGYWEGQRPAVRATACGQGNGLRSGQRPGGRYHRMRLSRPVRRLCLLSRCVSGTRSGMPEHRRRLAPGPRLGQDCQSVRIYTFGQRPRQDSNLRSRLRRALPCSVLTWLDVPNKAPWGTYRARERGLERAVTPAQWCVYYAHGKGEHHNARRPARPSQGGGP